MSAKTINGCYDGNDMYMTEPIMDFDRIKKLPAEKIFNFNNNDLLIISNNVRFRKEDFGWIVYVYNNIEFCTDEGFDFIKELQKKDNFTVNGLIKDFNVSEELIVPVISKFIKSKIISIIN